MVRKSFAVLVFGLIFTVMTVPGVFAAGGNQQQGTSGPVTIDVGANNPLGYVTNTYWADVLLEDLGIRVNQIDDSLEATQRMLAAGDWADVVRMVSQPQPILDAAIQLGLVVNFDDYKAKLPNVYANTAAMLQYHRDLMSNGTGGVYSLSSGVSPVSDPIGGAWVTPYMRWDLYRELGMPEINELEDYLPVIKQIVDLYPVTEDGQKVYGLSYHQGYNFPHYITFFYGARNIAGGWYEYDSVKNTGRSRFDDDSYFKRATKFIFTANQMGLLDPDSVTQSYDNYRAKTKAGRVIWTPHNDGQWNTPERVAQGLGRAMVPFKNMKMAQVGQPTYLGSYIGYTAAKKSPRLDKVLELLDYLYSVDGLWKLYNGPRGVMWDIDGSGEPYVTRQGIDIRYNQAEFPLGGKRSEGIGLFTNMPGIGAQVKHPVYNRRYDGLDWIRKDYEPDDSALVKDWQRAMNARDEADYFDKNNMSYIEPVAPMDSPPANIVEIETRTMDLVNTEVWKAILAKDEAEFNSIWNNMVRQAKVIGIDTAVQWRKEAYAKALALGSRYMFK